MSSTSELLETIDRDDWEQRELYANFGLAVYLCQVLETGLVNYVALLRGKDRQFGLSDEEHDELFEDLFGRTFGRNLTEARRLLGPAARLLEGVDDALSLRNDLIHHWLRDRALDQTTSEKRLALVEELKVAQQTIIDATTKIEGHFRELWEQLGLDWTLIEDEYARLRESQ